MERLLFPMFVFAYLSITEIPLCLSHSESSELNARSPLPRHPFYPYPSSLCLCSRGESHSFFQCEGKFSLESYLRGEVIGVECNETADSSDLNHDYQYLMGFDKSGESSLALNGCPEPLVSYARQFFLSERDQKFVGAGGYSIYNGVKSLGIDCARRKEFAITRKHLEGLTKLETFSVTCSALKSLPGDMFRGTTPNVRRISISGTRVEYVPSGIFHDLERLEVVHLRDNFIKEINGEAFLRCGNLSELTVRGNRLSRLDEGLLDALENITGLDLSGNDFRAMPENFRKLWKLEELDLSRNRLERMSEGHCDGLSRIVGLNVSYNGMTRIHHKCFGGELFSLDISGNALRNVTDNPIAQNTLNYIYFNGNSVPNLSMRQFFKSRELLSFYATESDVSALENHTLYGFPNLESVYFSFNGISSIPENLFVKNTRVRIVHFQRNRISSLPSRLFFENKELYHLDLSWNRIRYLPNRLFPEECRLKELHLSHNRIENLPERFLANITSLSMLVLSNNNISSLRSDLLMDTKRLDRLDLSYNRLFEIESEFFFPFKVSLPLRALYLRGNYIGKLPVLRLKSLRHLDISRNRLQDVPDIFFRHLPLLQTLNFSNNNISYVEVISPNDRYYILKTSILVSLDLSCNNLESFTLNNMGLDGMIKSLTFIDLSNNRFESFHFRWLDFAPNLEKLNLSRNNINVLRCRDKFIDYPRIGCDMQIGNFTALRIIDASNNNLDFNSNIQFEKKSLTWGCISPFAIFPNLEELLLRNNSITSICLDWRNDLPNLKLLDLSFNKLRFLSHQDMVFRSTPIDERIGFGPYHWPHKLTVDVRHNAIRFVELPSRMLTILPKKNETKGSHGHVTILLEENPYHCGCSVFSLFRVIEYEVALTTQLKRVTGRDGVYPAKLDVGNLSCSAPDTVRGKKINNTDEWLHHLIPLFGICTLSDMF